MKQYFLKHAIYVYFFSDIPMRFTLSLKWNIVQNKFGNIEILTSERYFEVQVYMSKGLKSMFIENKKN